MLQIEGGCELRQLNLMRAHGEIQGHKGRRGIVMTVGKIQVSSVDGKVVLASD